MAKTFGGSEKVAMGLQTGIILVLYDVGCPEQGMPALLVNMKQALKDCAIH